MKKYLCLLILGCCFVLPLQAADQIWGALVFGVDESPPKTPETQVIPLLKHLIPVFGFNTYYLLGKKKQRIKEGDETWLVPAKEFYFHLFCLAREKDAYRLRIELYRDKEKILATEVRLGRSEPLFVAGPEWGDGKLILILRVL